jgi:hypothetical protein
MFSGSALTANRSPTIQLKSSRLKYSSRRKTRSALKSGGGSKMPFPFTRTGHGRVGQANEEELLAFDWGFVMAA